MKPSEILASLQIDDLSATPKYQQLVNSIITGIRKGHIRKGDVLPSINEISFEFTISRVTVEKGYNYLRKIGVLASVPGKGYYIKSENIGQNLKIFLLFNKLSNHKKIIYDAFVEALGEQATVDFYIYNNDVSLFQRIINHQKDEDYTHYVIIPHFIEGEDRAYALINSLPKEKLILLDQLPSQITGEFSSVYEHFEQDLYLALEQAKELLSKYHTLKIIFPENSYFPQEIIKGFENFCSDYAFQSKVVHSIADEFIQEGEVYLNLMEDDLVILIEKVIASSLRLGEQIGIISYNETPLKRFILNGLTTISTDFKVMGQTAAVLVLSQTKQHIQNPFYLTIRASL